MRFSAILKMAAAGVMAAAVMAVPGTAAAQGSDTVLKPSEVQKLLPASVYYKGQSATPAGGRVRGWVHCGSQVGGHRRGRARATDRGLGRRCGAEAAYAAPGPG